MAVRVRLHDVSQPTQPQVLAPPVAKKAAPAPVKKPARKAAAPVSKAPEKPAAKPAPAKEQTAYRSAASRTHEVRTGETLWEIARENSVSVESLQKANGLEGATIRPGMELKIPAAGAPAEPELAARGHTLLYQRGDGEGFLTTVAANGTPRIHPLNVGVVDGRLLVFVLDRSAKARDLQSNPHFALHAHLTGTELPGGEQRRGCDQHPGRGEVRQVRERQRHEGGREQPDRGSLGHRTEGTPVRACPVNKGRPTHLHARRVFQPARQPGTARGAEALGHPRRAGWQCGHQYVARSCVCGPCIPTSTGVPQRRQGCPSRR